MLCTPNDFHGKAAISNPAYFIAEMQDGFAFKLGPIFWIAQFDVVKGDSKLTIEMSLLCKAFIESLSKSIGCLFKHICSILLSKQKSPAITTLILALYIFQILTSCMNVYNKRRIDRFRLINVRSESTTNEKINVEVIFFPRFT